MLASKGWVQAKAVLGLPFHESQVDVAAADAGNDGDDPVNMMLLLMTMVAMVMVTMRRRTGGR